MTQQAIADQAGVTQQQVSLIWDEVTSEMPTVDVSLVRPTKAQAAVAAGIFQMKSALKCQRLVFQRQNQLA